MNEAMYQNVLFKNHLDNLLHRFEEIHNFIYANDGLSEQQVLEEIVKILFTKYYDEQHAETLFYARINESSHHSSFIDRIYNLFEQTKQKYQPYFDSKENLKLSHQSLFFVINSLQDIHFSKSTKDVGGLAFQKFLGRHAKCGRGQFFTPDPVVDFCVKMIKPRPNEKIIDPACGTGSFLFSSLNYIKELYKDESIHDYVKNNLFGIEINKRVSQIAKIKFLIETNSDPNIICHNALKSLNSISFLNIKCTSHFYDVVLTNPPFGTQGKVFEKEILSNYDLGHKWNELDSIYYKSDKLLKGQIPDVLFIEQCLNLLKPSGRLGIVLPNGHFENASMQYLRDYIKEKAFVIAIVSLPQETFIPYGTGVKSSLLFLQKKQDMVTRHRQIFFSKINKIGYTGNKNGTPVYKKNTAGEIDEDLTESINDYHHFLKNQSIKNSRSFSISSQELNNRFDYDYYSPENRNLITILKKLDAVKIEDIANIVKVKSSRIKLDNIVQYIELSDIYVKYFEIVNSSSLLASELPSRASYEVRNGDIITAVAGNSIGTKKHATAYVTQEYDKSICTNGFRVLRDSQISHYYLLYYFQSDLFLQQILMYRTGAAIPAISDKDFSKILVYLPAKEKMDKIIFQMKNFFKLRDDANCVLSKIDKEDDTNSILVHHVSFR